MQSSLKLTLHPLVKVVGLYINKVVSQSSVEAGTRAGVRFLQGGRQRDPLRTSYGV